MDNKTKMCQNMYIYLNIQSEPELLLQKNMVDIGC